MTEPKWRDEESSFAIDVKGGGRASNRRKGPKRKTEEVYCHQCQRGRLLEIVSLMAKEEVEAKEKTSEKNRGRVHLQR